MDGRRIEVEVEQDLAKPVKLTFSDYDDDRAQLSVLLPRIFFTRIKSDSFLNERAQKSVVAFSGVMSLLSDLITRNAEDYEGRMQVLEYVQGWVHGELAKVAMERSDAEARSHKRSK
jgi:hypothetical protein